MPTYDPVSSTMCRNFAPTSVFARPAADDRAGVAIGHVQLSEVTRDRSRDETGPLRVDVSVPVPPLCVDVKALRHQKMELIFARVMAT